MARNLFSEQQPRNLFDSPQTVMGARSLALTGQDLPPAQGGSRMTPQMEALPELRESGILGGEDKAKIAALTPALLTATNPNEISKIITSNFPEINVVYDRDRLGGVYPVLVNNKTGAATIINKPGLTGMDVVQGLGLAAAFTPAARAASIPGAMAGSAATEAAIQATQSASGGEFNKSDIALSGVLGGVGKAVEGVSSAGLRISQGTPESQLVKEGLEQGVPVLTSDVIPPSTFASKALRETGEKIPILGTGEIRAAQQQARNESVDRIAEKYGQFSYDSIIDSLKAQRDKIKSAAGNVLSNTGEKLNQYGRSVPYIRTKDAVERAKAELSKPGMIGSEAAMQDIDTLANALSAGPKFTDLKELRTSFREIVKGTDVAERSQLTSRTKGLLGGIEKALGDDMRSFARQNLTADEFAKWSRANQVYAEEAMKMTKTRLKSLLDKGDVTPEVVQNMLFSKKPSEVALLYKNLTPSGKSNARSALISKVIQDATKPSRGVTPNDFANSMRKFEPQINIVFRGEEKAKLEGLKRVLQATSRAQEASVTTPTGQNLMVAGTALAGATLPIETLAVGGTIAGLTRLYESAPVRNALLRLASVPPRSNSYDVALREAVQAITTASQSLRSLEQGQESKE